MPFTTLTDPETPVSPPNINEPYQTIDDYEWALTRFTSPAWRVTGIDFEDNDHASAHCTVLEATLSHESGSLIQVLPFDPWEHQPGPTVYRRHRVRLRDTASDENTYVTIDEDDEDGSLAAFDTSTLLEVLSKIDTHPFEDAVDACMFHPQRAVHQADRKMKDLDTEFGRGYSIEAIGATCLAVFAAAQRVSQQSQRQTGLDAFAPE